MPSPLSAGTVVTEIMSADGGTLHLQFDAHALASLGLRIRPIGGGEASSLMLPVLGNSDLTVIVANDQLGNLSTGALLSQAGLMLVLPEHVARPAMILEITPGNPQEDGTVDFVIRDAATDEVLFTLYGSSLDYDAGRAALLVENSLIRLGADLAMQIGRPDAAGMFVGRAGIDALLHVTSTLSDTVEDSVWQPLPPGNPFRPFDTFPTNGPDVIVGVISGVSQSGRSGSVVGLGVGTDSCNKGDVPLHWFAMPQTDHPVIPQNLYRLKNGRFEQIGQSWLKHAFTALQNNICGFGCTSSGTGTLLGVGCSDPYGASLNASQAGLGARAWVHPFTGFYTTAARDHTGHTDNSNGIEHRLQVNDADLDPAQNAGALYFAEAQYVSPHDASAGNQFNNASYRQVNVSGAVGGIWTFTFPGSTVREQPAINAWTGATQSIIEPAPGQDGWAILAYQTTDLSTNGSGPWHYEYALYNMHLDRAIRRFSLPLGCGVNVSNVGFHAVTNHVGALNDGSAGSAGFSNAPWEQYLDKDMLRWRTTEDFATNPNANAIRWGTLYNFRFDANRPPATCQATVGFFKVASTMTVTTKGPKPVAMGDLNDDGSVNATDVGMFVSFLLNTAVPTNTQACAGNVNNDLTMDSGDIQGFVNLVAQ